MTQLLTTTELAALLKITPRKVRALATSRRLPFIRLGRKSIRFEPDAVFEALRRLEVKAIGTPGTQSTPR